MDIEVEVNGQAARLTTEHPASSYGVPVVVLNGVAYGPGDVPPGMGGFPVADGTRLRTCGECWHFTIAGGSPRRSAAEIMRHPRTPDEERMDNVVALWRGY